MEITKKPLVATSTESRTITFTMKQLLIAVGAVIVIIGALVIWRIVEGNRFKKEYAVKEESIKSQARAQLVATSERHLKLLAKPYTWAVRTALLQSNLVQVNEYANDIVKEKNVISVMVVDTKNTVVSSTNKKYEGKDYLSFGQANYLSVDSATVNKVNDSLLVLTSPVMSFNNRLGTIVFSYAVPSPVFTAPAEQ
ncbi:MAG: hypothetical protein M3Y85_03690 [Bacteroidota bacterium]|nr:hypothetical protein [Bacteroidota bacterium]